MTLRARVFCVLAISGTVTLSLVLYLSNSSVIYGEGGWLAGPEGPRQYVQGLYQIPGPDKILGTVLTHVLRPELSERVHVPEGDPEILVSVKTTTLYHQHRLSLLLFTWMQTLSPKQLYIVTDGRANDIWIRKAQLSGIHVVKAKCPTGHTSKSLCCKSGLEYEQFYSASGKGHHFRWFCHFDDDEYLNIVNLSKKLNTYNSSADYYVGHWLTKHGNKPKRLGRFRNFPETERKSYFYATGASYCLSSGLMRRVEKYFRGKSFSAACERMALTDDYTIGSVIGGVLGIDLTEVSTMLSQGEDFTHFNTSQLQHMITISSKLHASNRIKIPHSVFSKSEDPTGFLSYHCLLYPQVNWCQNKTLHVYKTYPLFTT